MYAYCKNNPINFVDPSGHFAFAIPIIYPIGQALINFAIVGLGVWSTVQTVNSVGKPVPKSKATKVKAKLSSSKINRRFKNTIFKRATRVRNRFISVNSKLTPYQAAVRVLRSGDIWTKYKGTAKGFAAAVSGGYVGPEKSKGRMMSWHYHLKGRFGGHIFYAR